MSDSGAPRDSEHGMTEATATPAVLTSQIEEQSQPPQISKEEKPKRNTINCDALIGSPPHTSKESKRSRIPVLNKETVNPDTFDLDRLLDPAVQKRAQAHRVGSSRNPINSGSFLKRSSLATSPKKPTGPSVTERFAAYHENSKKRLEEEKRKKEENELSACSFRPSIAHDSATTPRNPEKFYADMLKFKSRTEKRNEESRKLHIDEEFSFKPTICERSHRLHSKRSLLGLPCHERLFQLYKGFDRNSSVVSILYNPFLSEFGGTDRNFVPEISHRAKELFRNKPIEVTLYEDAVKRSQRTCAPPAFSQARASKQSLRLLTNRFSSKYEALKERHDALKTGRVQYSGFICMLSAMEFLSSPLEKRNAEIPLVLELWKLLSRQGGSVALDDLKVAMMGVMGYYQSWMSDKSRQKFTLSEAGTKRFHQKYHGLNYKKETTGLVHDNDAEAESTIKTRLSARQRTVKVEDKLMQQGVQRTLCLQFLQSQSESRSLDECTFQPYIKHHQGAGTHKVKTASSLYRQNSEKTNVFDHLHGFSQFLKDKNSELVQQRELESEREIKRTCTFTPEINKRKEKLDLTAEKPQGPETHCIFEEIPVQLTIETDSAQKEVSSESSENRST